MKAFHWPLEKGDKVDISLRVMISVCICLHMCVCLRHISELYDKTHQHITTRWNGGRRGRTDGGRDWKKWMTQGGVSISLSLTQCGSSGKGRAAQCKHVCVNSSMGRGQLFEMTVMAANAQSVCLPTDLFIHTHSHNDHNELTAKHKCATNTFTVHTCHLCMAEWQPQFLCCAFMGKISCL